LLPQNDLIDWLNRSQFENYLLFSPIQAPIPPSKVAISV